MFNFDGESSVDCEPPVDCGDGDSKTVRSQQSPSATNKDRSTTASTRGYDTTPLETGDAGESALLPVIKELSDQFASYAAEMELAVRDMAESELQQRHELQQLQQRASQALAAHEEKKLRFQGRLGTVTRVLSKQASPE